MDLIWQWAWDHYGRRYSWAVFAISACAVMPMFILLALLVLTYEDAHAYGTALAIGAVGTVAVIYVTVLPGLGPWRLIEQWAQRQGDDPRRVISADYAFTRRVIGRGLVAFGLGGAAVGALVAKLAGAGGGRAVQHGALGFGLMESVFAIAMHTFIQSGHRPIRLSAGDATGCGDDLPRSRPRFTTWLVLAVLGVAWFFTALGTLLGVITDQASRNPLTVVAIATVATALIAVPVTISTALVPGLQPIRDLAVGTKRVGDGDFTHRVPVVQDDDLGVLSGSFNQMQAGLAQRERLRAAFGSYVDPALAGRLLEQGGEVFAGERRNVTVMFVDIRDFTPFAETNTAEDTVSRLNALFEIVVPAVLSAGGHVNKYLGDGALAVFGAPIALAHHPDAAMAAALEIRQQVAQRFAGAIRIGIGINTGQVIAGTIGGGGKLEFTLIGDAVNVAARVEQLTKTTKDVVLLTQDTVDALAGHPAGLIDRGSHELKGKAAAVHVYAIDWPSDQTAV